jgi:AhpD family alkylhydroperoxidase
MSVVSLLKKSEAPITVRSMFSDTNTSPLVSTMAHVPELIAKAMPFIGQALGASSINIRAKEIMILRASSLMKCVYCIKTHTVVAERVGLSLLEIRALRDEQSIESAFSEAKEILLIQWTDALTNGPAPIERELKEEMKQYYCDAEIVEMSLCIGATLMLNRYATALDLPVDPGHLLILKEKGLDFE